VKYNTKKLIPDFKFEKVLWKRGYYVIGVDEVGRGALAGPLCAGAVCFPIFSSGGRRGGVPASAQNFSPATAGVRALARRKLLTESEEIEKIGINDSKKLSPAKREKLAKIIKKSCLAYASASISSKVIDNIGITKATQIAMRKAVREVIKKISKLVIKNEFEPKRNYLITQLLNYFLLVDAFYIKYLKGIGLKNQKAIIHGDEKSISIATASIIAKVERDHNMIKLDQEYPIYFWKNNKGYGTKKHIEAIKSFGRSKWHRDLFLRKIKNQI